MNLPTQLTLIRIAAIPVFVVVFYLPFKWAHPLTAAIFGLAALTDWLDGYLARRLGQTSSFGAFLDPVADKLMIGVALILLVELESTVWLAIPAIIIIGREIAVSALREWMGKIGKSATVAVSMTGKVKTTLQIIALLFLLYQQPFFGMPIHMLGFVLLYMAAALTLWSGVVYMQAAWPALTSDRRD